MPRRSALHTHGSSGVIPHLNGGVLVIAWNRFWCRRFSLHTSLHRRDDVRVWIPVVFLVNWRKARAWVSSWLEAGSLLRVQNSLFVCKVLREYCLLVQLQKANFACWSRVTHAATRGYLIEQCLVFWRCSKWIFCVVIAFKRIIVVLYVSSEVHRKVGTVDLQLK
jgi:hypothetical protein